MNIRPLVAEFLGTALLVAAVVGSGIMATSLTTDVGLALLINAVATVAALAVLIWALLPVSGAHLNPAVTVVALLQRQLSGAQGSLYMCAQVLGGICGAIVANVMFSLPAWHLAGQERTGPGLLLGELIATGGLVAVIVVAVRTKKTHLLPGLVAAWIGAAYFFTASTSFANPAVTIGRVFSDSFAGIAVASIPLFITAQLAGAVLGLVTARYLFPQTKSILKES